MHFSGQSDAETKNWIANSRLQERSTIWTDH